MGICKPSGSTGPGENSFLGGKQIEKATSAIDEKPINWFTSQRFDNQINGQSLCEDFQRFQQFERRAHRVDNLGAFIEVQSWGSHVIILYVNSHELGLDIGGRHLETASL